MISKTKKYLLVTEMYFQILATLLLSLVTLYCEFVLGESIMVNLAVCIALPVLFSIPSLLMFKDLGLYKVHTLFCSLFCQIICLILLYYYRNKVILIHSAYNNINLKLLKQFLNYFNENSSLLIFIVGPHVGDEFSQSVTDNKLERIFLPYLMKDSAVISKIKEILKSKDFSNITGFCQKLLILYETNDIKVIESLKERFYTKNI